MQRSIKEGDLLAAEEQAARSRGEARKRAYTMLADASIQRRNYPAALRYYTTIEDHQGLFAFGQMLGRMIRDGEVEAQDREATIVAVLVAYRRASQFANKYMTSSKGFWVAPEKAIAPEGIRFAVWLGLKEEKYFGAAEAIAVAASIPPPEYGEFIGKLLWDYYLEDPEAYHGFLPLARTYLKMAGETNPWLLLVEYAIGHELVIQRKFDEALAAYGALGDGEARAMARVGYDLLSPRGRKSYEVEGILESLAWFERAADAVGRDKANLALCEAYLRAGRIAEAEAAFRESGAKELRYAESLAEAWAGAGQSEKAAFWYKKAGRTDEAMRLYFELAEARIQAGEYGAALAFLEESGKPDKQMERQLASIAAWCELRGDDEKAASLYQRARELEKAAAANRRVVAAAVASGDFIKAIATGKASGDPSIIDDAYRGLAGALIASGKAREAIDILLKGLESRGRALRLCVEAITERLLWKELQPFLSLAGSGGAEACRGAVAALRARGDHPGAVRLLAALGDKEQASRVASDAIRQARLDGRFADAAEVAIAAGIARGEAYSSFASEALKKDKPELALELYGMAGLKPQDALLRVAEGLAAGGNKAGAAEFYEKSGKKDKAAALRSEQAAALLAEGRWEEAALAMQAIGLPEAEIRKRGLEAASKRRDWERYFALKVEDGLEERDAARSTAEAALGASGPLAAASYYERAGEAEQAAALLAKAAGEELKLGGAARAAELYERAGRKAEAERARLVQRLGAELQSCLSRQDAKAAEFEAIVARYRGELDGEGIAIAAAGLRKLYSEQSALIAKRKAESHYMSELDARQAELLSRNARWLEPLVGESRR